EDGIRDFHVTGVQTCALPISSAATWAGAWGPGAPIRPRTKAPTARAATLAARAMDCQPGRDRGRSGTTSAMGPRSIAAISRSGRSEERRVGKGWRYRGAPDRE